jgi:cytochrome c oxidase subunit II
MTQLKRMAVAALGAALLVGVGAAVATIGAGRSGAAAAPQIVKMSVKKFEYSLSEIKVRKGIPVVIEITSLDRLHGFSLPGFKLRGDVVPGQVTRIEFTPETAGSYVYLCDIFCGDGHEEVNGTLIVTD